MKLSLLNRTKRSKVTIISVFAVVAMLATNSTVNVLSVQAQVTTQNNEVQKLLGNIEKEAKRRDVATTKATETLDKTTTLSPQAKSQVLQSLNESKKANDTTLAQAKNTKDLAGMQQLAKGLDQQYDKYATSQSQGMLLGDSDQQAQSQQQLTTTAQDIQSKLNSNKESGQDTSSQQLELDNIIELITAVAAILASVVALIVALVAGDYTQAATLFLAIVGQLAQNLATILNIQSSLELMVGSVS